MLSLSSKGCAEVSLSGVVLDQSGNLLVAAKREASAPSRFLNGHACQGVFLH
jgi:hypothetical protein